MSKTKDNTTTEKEQGSGGAPRKDDMKKLTETKRVAFTSDEYETLIQEYKKSECSSFSGFLRYKILRKN